ncbi:MAG: 3-phosphoshikimate 1-carboxyvinyltransferase [Parachlamydiaceae bacterium]|nr:3-phosphoshikimate 1-carboxyvinyltransferase [Parachlamydiaceae bacterium]
MPSQNQHREFPPTRLCVPIIGPTYLEVGQQLNRAVLFTDLVELRLDKWESIDSEKIERLIQLYPLISMIFCLRKKSQGGVYHGSETERISVISSLLLLKPHFIDIEADVPIEIIKKLQDSSQGTKWIVSWHDFESTPEHLEAIYRHIKTISADYYKIATHAQSTYDALRMLCFAKTINSTKSILCALCMGQEGESTRILSPLVGCPFMYAALDDGLESAPGQIPIRTLLEKYNFKTLDKSTVLFGLIGNPVDKSPSDTTHNAVLSHFRINGVYVKFNVKEESLHLCLKLLKTINLRGLSVTMPYKEKVMEYLDLIDHSLTAIGSCNTLLYNDSILTGCNTDGKGAIDVLGSDNIKEKQVVIIGSGGTARAIISEVKKHNAQITVLNRTSARSEEIAEKFNIKWGSLSDLSTIRKSGYDILIQTTPVGMMPDINSMPISSDDIDPKSVVLDVILNPRETRLLQEAAKMGCKIHSGIEMFLKQAVRQFTYWLGNTLPPNEVEDVLRKNLGFPNKMIAISSSATLRGTITIPSSKSHSIRAILLGAMAEGKSSIKNALNSPDITQAITAAKQLGAYIEVSNNNLVINGVGGKPCAVDSVIDVGNSGQVLRFVAALTSLNNTHTILTGDHSIRTNRPIQHLLEGLEKLNVSAESITQNGYAPIKVKGPMIAGETTLSGEDSQPVSALLMASAFVDGITTINVKNAGEKPWINLTLSWLDRLGISYTNDEYERYTVNGKSIHKGFTYTVPSDFSSLAFPLVAALITNSEITIENVDMNDIQGDKLIIPLLKEMGGNIVEDPIHKRLHVKRGSKLQGKVIDVNPMIDAIVILAVLGCFANGETHIFNGRNARNKECDRIECITMELRKMGADITATDDGLIIRKSNLNGATVKSHDDHRIALSLLVASFAARGETCVEGIECIDKSYLGFIDDMNAIGAHIKIC